MTQRNDHWQLALHRGQLQSRVMSRQARAISVHVKTYDRVASCRGRNPLGRIRGTGPIAKSSRAYRFCMVATRAASSHRRPG